MMNKYIGLVLGCLVVALTAFLLMSHDGTDRDRLEAVSLWNTGKSSPLPQIIRDITIYSELNLAGERIPIEEPDVRERMERELLVNSYWHSTTMVNLQRTKKYFPTIERILAEENIPQDFKYLAVAESNLENATSGAGAKGIWQIMKTTGAGYGLEINKEVDERYHLEKSTRVACKVLRDYYNRFGSWTLAAAAYNLGETRMAREIDLQGEHRYYDLNLANETMRYVFRIVAIKTIYEDPSYFGFFPEDDSAYHSLENYSHVIVDKSIPSLGEWADQYGVSYRKLKIYNPWLRTHKLTVSSGNSYKLKIPR